MDDSTTRRFIDEIEMERERLVWEFKYCGLILTSRDNFKEIARMLMDSIEGIEYFPTKGEVRTPRGGVIYLREYSTGLRQWENNYAGMQFTSIFIHLGETDIRSGIPYLISRLQSRTKCHTRMVIF